MNVWIAVRNATTVTPASTSAAGLRPPLGRGAEHVGEQRRRAPRRGTPRAAAGRTSSSCRWRRRSRSSRRARRRRRRRAGTGRRAGCGRRPGRRRRRARASRRRAAPSTTRGARSCQRIAESVAERCEWTSEERHVRERRRARSAPTPMSHGPDEQPDQHRARRGTRSPPTNGPEGARRGGDATTASSSPTCSAAMLTSPASTFDPGRDLLHEVDDPRPPARGDVVAHREHAAVLDRRDRAPAGRASRRFAAVWPQHIVSASTISCRARPRRCTPARASGSRSRSCRPRRRCPSARASCRCGR